MPDLIRLEEEKDNILREKKKRKMSVVYILMIPAAIAYVGIFVVYIEMLKRDFIDATSFTEVLRSTMFVIIAIAFVSAVYISFLLWYIKTKRDMEAKQQALLLLELNSLKKHQQFIMEKLEAAERRSEEAENAKKNFLFSMSHDIRTPMNAITGFTKLAKRVENNPSKTLDYLDKISVAEANLLSLVENVLEMARIEDGTIVPMETPVDMSHALNKTLTIFESMAAEKNIKLTGYSKIEYPYVYEDENLDAQCALNIVSNAIKFTEPGGRVDISLTQLPGRNDEECVLEFKCVDTGIGMSKEFLEHAFDRFSRERTSTISNVQGTGVGLEIVKRLVDLNGGTVTIDSEQGLGTTVTVQTYHKFASKELFMELEQETDYGDHPLKGYKVLLVEDNELNLEIAKEVLVMEGAYVECAENGQEACDLLVSRGPGYYDVVVMDIQMPVMDGYTATRKIRKMENPRIANIPIVAMTANALEEDKQDAIAAGMNAHLSKPIVVADFVRVLREVTE